MTFFMKMITTRTMMKITTLITLIIIVNEFLCKVKLMIVTNFIENDSYVKNDCQLCVFARARVCICMCVIVLHF